MLATLLRCSLASSASVSSMTVSSAVFWAACAQRSPVSVDIVSSRAFICTVA